MNMFQKAAMAGAFVFSAAQGMAQTKTPTQDQKDEGAFRSNVNVGFNFVKEKGNYNGGPAVKTYQGSVGTDFNGFPNSQSVSVGKQWKTVKVPLTAKEQQERDTLDKQAMAAMYGADTSGKNAARIEAASKTLNGQIGARQGAVLKVNPFVPATSYQYGVAGIAGQHVVPGKVKTDSVSRARGTTEVKSGFVGFKANADMFKPYITKPNGLTVGANLGVDAVAGTSFEGGPVFGVSPHLGAYVSTPVGKNAVLNFFANGVYEPKAVNKLGARVGVSVGFN